MESVFGIWQLAMTLAEMKDKLLTITLARHNGRQEGRKGFGSFKEYGLPKN